MRAARVRARGRGGLATAALLVVVTTVGPSLAPAAAQGEESRAEIQRLLDRRAQALIERDRDAFLATISDDNEAFRDRQEDLFEGFASMDLAEYSLEANWSRYGDLARRSDARRYDGARVMLPLTEERYRIRGFDAAPAVEDMFFTFVERDGRWLIANDSDLESLGLFSGRHPWDFGSVSVTHTGNFLLIQTARGGCASTPADLAPTAQRALDRVKTYWTPPWRKKVILVVPCNGEELQRMLQATFDPSKFVAFAYSSLDVENGYRFTGHRVIVNPPVFNGRGADETLSILAHELLHVASRDVSGPFVPLLVDEGVADLVGYAGAAGALGFLDSVVATGGFDGSLPDDFAFSIGSGSEIFLSYQEAHSAMSFIADGWGRKAVIDLYVNLGARGYEPGLARWHLDDALRATLGIGLKAFEQRWADSIA
ncbi:MAG: hypothetical protein M3277_02910 [Actinomycetota bacterium]|nr:hypothetical protein [Actinomycetota bacterium]